MKKILCAVLALFVLATAQAQTTIALTGGIHNTSTTPAYLAYPDTSIRSQKKSSVGGLLGFTVATPVYKKWHFQTGVFYAARGSQWIQFYDTANLYANTRNLPASRQLKKISTTTRLRLRYIDLPLNLMYKHTGKKGTTSWVLGAGPQLSFFFNGKTSGETFQVTQFHPHPDSLRFKPAMEENNDLPVGKGEGQFRILHFGWNAFAGIEGRSLSLTINYTSDINPIYTEENRKFRQSSIGLRLGVFLGNQKKKKTGPSKTKPATIKKPVRRKS